MGPPWGILGHSGVILEPFWRPCWDILGLSWENLAATWVQGRFAEMPKLFWLGPCAAKALACEHTSSTMASCEMEIVDLHIGFISLLDPWLGGLDFIETGTVDTTLVLFALFAFPRGDK